jgi:hypothetical protein
MGSYAGVDWVVRRRSFLMGMTVAGAAAVLSPAAAAASTDDLTDGDAAILRFLAAGEIIESDLWGQYTELGGVNINGASDAESPGVPPDRFNAPYVKALQNIDVDMPQYITDNTDDEFSHAAFINGYSRPTAARRSTSITPARSRAARPTGHSRRGSSPI